jgi:ribosomal-protein-alanine N-acetyltransferase
MQFTFGLMTKADILEIQTWHFNEPYTIYNLSSDNFESNCSEMLDRRSPYYAAHDIHNQLIGHFNFGTSAEPWDHETTGLYSDSSNTTIPIGLGLRPDLTGKGLGTAFMNAGLDFAKDYFQPENFKLFVLSFNERAIRVYERVGFKKIGTFSRQTEQGTSTFLEMLRKA